MALTASEEALVRQLLDQQAAILSLAGNEATITSKLGATKVTLADLVAASSLADADLLLTRQGTTDKSVTAAILAQYILAELAPGFVNVSGDTMTGALALFGGDTGVTPPQFDNDTSLATAAFVQRALGSFSGVSVLSGATALTAADIGKNIILSGSSAFATTLPATAGLPNGAAVSIENNASIDCTVVRSGSDVIAPNASSAISTITIPAGTQITFVKVNAVWYAFGSGAASYQSNFGSSLSSFGYQKLPSGLIIQWGEVAPGTASVFPIAFPTACYTLAIAYYGATGASSATWSQMSVATSNTTVTPHIYADRFRYIAIGK